MTSTIIKRGAVASLTALGLLSMAQKAHAINCSDVGGATGHRIFLTGSTAAVPFMSTLGKALAAATSPIYLIYNTGNGSCDGVHAVLDTNPIGLTGSKGQYYVAADFLDGGAAPTCTFNGEPADVGLSDVYYNSCVDFRGTTLPASVGDFKGPNQVMEFVVPAASSQQVISAAAAYYVFGLGAAGMVSPWTGDDTFIYRRTAASGTQSMIAAAIGVKPELWKGHDSGGSGALRDALNLVSSNAANAEKSIGILAADVADGKPKTSPTDGLTRLAYQHYGQSCGYWADSTSSSFDKKNVRDGHYPIWGPVHFYTKVDANKKPLNADVDTVIQAITSDSPSEDVLKAEISAHTVPLCAMKVDRSTEVGPYTPYKPAHPCGCFFEKQLGGGASCVGCDANTPCAAGSTCSFHFCEAN